MCSVTGLSNHRLATSLTFPSSTSAQRVRCMSQAVLLCCQAPHPTCQVGTTCCDSGGTLRLSSSHACHSGIMRDRSVRSAWTRQAAWFSSAVRIRCAQCRLLKAHITASQVLASASRSHCLRRRYGQADTKTHLKKYGADAVLRDESVGWAVVPIDKETARMPMLPRTRRTLATLPPLIALAAVILPRASTASAASVQAPTPLSREITTDVVPLARDIREDYQAAKPQDRQERVLGGDAVFGTVNRTELTIEDYA